MSKINTQDKPYYEQPIPNKGAYVDFDALFKQINYKANPMKKNRTIVHQIQVVKTTGKLRYN